MNKWINVCRLDARELFHHLMCYEQISLND